MHISGLMAIGLLALLASRAPAQSSGDVAGERNVIDFARSHLRCAPKKSGIVVRIQMECFCRMIDQQAGKTDEYALGVVAKTGLTKTGQEGKLAPGYDYWLIFSKDTVYTRRTHASAYLRHPTTLSEDEFGEIDWKVTTAPATKLADADAVRGAMESGKRLVARTQFASADGKRAYVVEYPVKWADYGVERKEYRVETGPIVLLDPDRAAPATRPALEDFQWAHVDFRDERRARLLVERPTELLSEAASFASKADKRESRPNPPVTTEQLAAIEKHLFANNPTTLHTRGLRELVSTDHYSDAVEKQVVNTLFAID